MSKQPLTGKEYKLLAELLPRVEWPLPMINFHSLVAMTVMVPIELAVFNENNHILLIQRDDDEYRGLHMPGTVLRNNEDVPTAMKRLLEVEVKAEVTQPISLGWTEIEKGDGYGQNSTRHEISLLHACWLKGDHRGEGEFYLPFPPPTGTLFHHKKLIDEILARLHTLNIVIKGS